MKSPFKFLSAYSKEDKSIFFGREEETRLLYDLVKKNKLVLVYGPSGTGKTSLVFCGLAGKFEITDWLPIRINRAGNLNTSLRNTLAQILQQKGATEVPDTTVDIIEEIYAENLRPVYLIFDQFEELFVFGTPDEQKIFIQDLESILKSQLPCRVLIILREEYMARLYQFEAKIPNILDNRLRIEPMSREKLMSVIKSSCYSFNIRFDDNEKTPFRIVDNLIKVRSGMALPYLQVYLDMFYKRDFELTYHRDRVGEELPELVFTLDEVNSFGEIENVLELFLNEQLVLIQHKLNTTYTEVTNDFLMQLLDAFVSESGTKRPVKYQLKEGLKMLPENVFPGMKPGQLKSVHESLMALEDARVLLDNEGSIELAHDSLAALIDRSRSELQRRINLIKRRLENAFFEYQSSGAILNREQLDDIRVLSKGLQPYLSEDWKGFIQKSELKVKEEENKVLLTERRKRRNALILAVIGFAMAAVSLFLFIDTKQNANVITALREKNTISSARAQLKVATTLGENGYYGEALNVLQALRTFADKENVPITDSINIFMNNWGNLAKLVAQGDSLVNNGNLKEAFKKYTEVAEKNRTKLIELKLRDTDNRMGAYQSYFAQGNQFEINGDWKNARIRYLKALEAKPRDPEVLLRLKNIDAHD